MSNENATSDNRDDIGQAPAGGHDSIRNVDTTTANPPALPTTNGNGLPNGHNGRHTHHGKSDSETETVVLSGNEEGRATTKRKTIKHEDLSDDQGKVGSKIEKRKPYNEPNDHRDGPNGARRPSLKRKRIVQDVIANDCVEGGNSSNLSSAYSSPAPQVASDKNHRSDSDRSRSSPPIDEDIRKKKSRLRKRKLESADDQEVRKRRGKSDPEAVNGKERREPRRARKQHTTSAQSESPPPHQHLRTHSTQTTSINSSVKRKKAPPSLSIDSRRKTFEDTGPDSDDSGSQKSRPRLHKSASVDEPMTSKLSHKKILDRSGRTPVARACANDNIEQLAAELKERPHHLNEPDYAQNTPLQIAALEGFVEPVRHLINEGCTVNCKNIDGDTPLIDAVENGHLQVVDILLEASADPRMRNGKGFEPLDLVNTESDDYEAIRDSLTAAKAKFSLRRQSEDQSTGAKDNDGASISAPGGSPTDSLQTQGSKPGSGGDTVAKGHSAKWEVDVGRRKTARREPTREDLLWITGTPARLKDAASKGDMEVVNACLNTLRADTESMLAAARGGHDDVLGLLIALGRPPEPDPEPLSSNEYRPGHDTPMLAAIGGGNVKVIKVLLGQPRFNPRRRMYHGLTYYELAKQRQSSNWQEEHDVLKEAYDKYSSDGGKSASSSPHKVRSKRPDSSSPLASSTSERPVGRIKRESSHKSSSYKHLHPNDTERKGSSSAVSDREAEGVDARKPKVRNGRSVSDAGSTANARSEPGTKPRRRLLSKNEIQSDQDIKRKASVAVEKSPPLSHASHEKSNRVSTDSPLSVPQDKKASPQDSSFKREAGKKRPRISTSPGSSLSEVHKDHDAVKKKRQRADSQGNAIEQERKDSMPRGPAMVANMIVNPEPVMSPIKTPGTAPVAFMGGSTASPPMVRSPIEQRKSINFPLGSLDVALQQDVAMPENLSFRHDAPILQPPDQAPEHLASTSESFQKAEDSVPEGLHTQKISPVMADERHAREEKAARDIEILKARGREALAARELEEAHLKAQREEAELQRQMQTEREEAEARAAKKQNDEQQMQVRRAEQERQQKEKEERRRAELEHREEQRRIRLQEEQEMQRRERLTCGLRRAAEISADEARHPGWIQNWLPLYYVTTEDLDPECDKEDINERWISNVQVAPLLANRDLELSQCRLYHVGSSCTPLTAITDTAWTHRPLTLDQRGSLWRQLRNQQSGVRIPELRKEKGDNVLHAESRRSFFTTLEPIFWLRYSDFLNIIPRHPHLTGLPLASRHMSLHDYPFGIGGTWDKETSEGKMSAGRKRGREEEEAPAKRSANGDLPNGHI